MWFQQLIRKETGCVTYLVGSSRTGECLVLDPLWAIEPYLAEASRHGLKITHVVDSHCHADHVSGARRLARVTGATLLLPKRMEARYENSALDPGDSIHLGEVKIDVIPAPGHRPEQINLLLYDLDRSEDPWCLLTADFLLVGDIARPDLAQDGRAGAQLIYEEAIPRLQGLPDYVEVYPGHVAGST